MQGGGPESGKPPASHCAGGRAALAHRELEPALCAVLPYVDRHRVDQRHYDEHRDNNGNQNALAAAASLNVPEGSLPGTPDDLGRDQTITNWTELNWCALLRSARR